MIPCRQFSQSAKEQSCAAEKGRCVLFLFTFVVFFIPATAKFISAIGNAPLVHSKDGLFGVTYRVLFLVTAIWEYFVAALMVARVSCVIKLWSIWYTSFAILLYRAIKRFAHISEPCPCLGGLSSLIPVKYGTIDIFLFSLGLFLFVFSSKMLIDLYRQTEVINGNTYSDLAKK
jgi:hypothetical protein